MDFIVNTTRVRDQVGDIGIVRGLKPGEVVPVEGGLRFETWPGQVLVEWESVNGEPVGVGQSSWEDRADLAEAAAEG